MDVKTLLLPVIAKGAETAEDMDMQSVLKVGQHAAQLGRLKLAQRMQRGRVLPSQHEQRTRQPSVSAGLSGGGSSFPMASLRQVASRPAVSRMPAASRPSPCVPRGTGVCKGK